MKVNFEIEENYAVQFQGRHLDLHNNFELVEIRDLEKEIEIEFRKSEGNWVPKDELNELIFTFKGISYKYEEEGESEPYPEDWKILGELSFFPSNMRDINDGFIPQSLPKKEDDILFIFENGRLIRINCDEVELKIK
ncbi:hypothetical protein [Xanthovirga aplysinae]|uniref:hypothetical protein n=1 Tax=Xanthovirga aplysinae TaxID=2529853 RepID=UPI0012BC16D3|nr:hypothetical protein [Xanthovirga aplysinae]MTI29924.1 hypothetical protein [Xanthovirga aplysinae]